MTSCFVNRGLRQSKEDNSKRLVRAGRPLFTPPPTSLMLSPSTSPFSVCDCNFAILEPLGLSNLLLSPSYLTGRVHPFVEVRWSTRSLSTEAVVIGLYRVDQNMLSLR
ncbi:unnamed protein product [Lepeophtheirus salmonis]|uniref:(salmon louse) hypothetical protein n=1 Tax=Lepeophtheirus salmonis TaxID=72036 RepID=A0A7R8D5G3_LEPSM|nr:unnamed protein product [Lepeophtheirus salmonis]CAF3035576.1 unnamed protein product [Lepeophtheirus salmonis]